MKNLKETTETRYHKKFTYYTNDSIIGRSLREYGEYGQFEIDFLIGVISRITNEPVVVYDVGANIGVHTTAFASTGAAVYAFEPNPLNFALLAKNTKNMTNVHNHKSAASNVAGDILITTFDPAEVGNYGELIINNNTGVAATSVRLDDLDIPAPNVNKIDAEGSELGVIQGCLEKIKANLPLIYYEAQEPMQLGKIYTILTELGYHLYWAVNYNYNKDNLKKNKNIIIDGALFNVIAVPPEWDKLTIEPVTGPDDFWTRFLPQ